MPTHDQQTTNFWFGESVVYTIFKAKAWRGATADNFPVVLLFKKKRLQSEIWGKNNFLSFF